MLAAALVAWLVAALGDRAVRGATLSVLGTRDERALITAMDVAIAAVLSDIPEESRVALRSALQERFSAPPTIVLDGRTSVRVGLMRAVKEQLAPLADDSIAPDGKSFLASIEVDSSQFGHELTGILIRAIEQVAAGVPELTPLMVQLNADAVLEKLDEMQRWSQKDKVLSRDSSMLARQLGRPASHDGFAQPLDLAQRLVDGMLAVPAVADDESRREVLHLLRSGMRDAIPRSPRPRLQVLMMLRTCQAYENGIPELIQAIRFIEGDTLPMRQLDQLIVSLDPTRAAHQLSPSPVAGPHDDE